MPIRELGREARTCAKVCRRTVCTVPNDEKTLYLLQIHYFFCSVQLVMAELN